MITETDLIVILCGVGTFLLRFLPIWKSRRKQTSSTLSGPLHRLFQGIGPAAITALLIVSLWPTFAVNFRPTSALGACLALLAIFFVKRLAGGIAGPTLVGAVLYGLFMHGVGM